MATIVTRSGKGSALTHTEADANFTNLNTDKVEGPDSSTDNAIARFDGTGGATVQNSSTTISDAGDIVVGGTTPTITIGDGGAEDAALVFDGNAQDFYIGLDDSADDLVIGLGSTLGTTPAMSIDENQVVTFHQDPIFGGTTPTITLGDGGAEDTALIYDGNALDFHIGLDDTADDLVIGTGSTLGANTLISINGDASEVKFNVPKITIGDATAEDTYLNFDGNAQDYRIGIDDGTDILEIGLGTAHGTTIALKIDSSANVTIPTKLIMSDVTSGKFLVGDGTSYEEVALSGDATLASGGALTVAAGAIENSMLANMAANTVKVRNANSSGDPSDVALATTEILIGDGTGFTAAALSGDVSMTNSGAVTIASAAVETAMVNANVVTGQTAETSIANDDIVLIYDTSATALRKMTKANFISGTGTGDASGPGSATDNAIARFDGTGGKTLQNSGSTIDDSGNLTAVAGTFTGAFTSLGIDDNADAVAITIDSAEKVGIGVTSPKTKVTIEGALTLKEQASADGDTAAYGQIWVKSDTPNTLYFTDDAGTDTALGAGGGAWELVASVTATDNTSVTIGGDSSPIFSSSYDTYVLTGIMQSNQDAFTPVQFAPILSGGGTTADTTDDVQHAAPMMRSNTALGSTALTWSHQDVLTGYNISLNYNPMGTTAGEAHAFQMWFYDPFQNASFAHGQLANATVSSWDSNDYTSVLTYAYKKPTTTAYVGLVITNGATGGVDYLLRLYGIKNS